MPPIPPNLPLAVVAQSASFAMDWIRMHFEVREIIGAKRRVILKDGRILQIVTTTQDVKGLEFCEYILCPDYIDLLTEVRERIRPYGA